MRTIAIERGGPAMLGRAAACGEKCHEVVSRPSFFAVLDECERSVGARGDEKSVSLLSRPPRRWRVRSRTMQYSMRWMACLLMVAAVAACGSEDEDEEGSDLPEVDCSGDIPTFGEVSAFSNVC